MLLLLFLMHHLGYLASSVTMVTSLLVHGRLLFRRGFEGRAAAQQRGRRRELGDVLIQIFWLSPLFSLDCSFNFWLFAMKNALALERLFLPWFASCQSIALPLCFSYSGCSSNLASFLFSLAGCPIASVCSVGSWVCTLPFYCVTFLAVLF